MIDISVDVVEDIDEERMDIVERGRITARKNPASSGTCDVTGFEV